MRQCVKLLYSRAGHRGQHGTCALHAGYLSLRIHTYTYCFPTATVVARTHPSVVSCVHCLSCFLFSDICNVSKKRGQMAHAPGPVRTDKTRSCQGTVFGCFERDTENYSLLCIGRSQERRARGVEFKHTIFRPPLVVIVLLMTHICHHVWIFDIVKKRISNRCSSYSDIFVFEVFIEY